MAFARRLVANIRQNIWSPMWYKYHHESNGFSKKIKNIMQFYVYQRNIDEGE